ncbi:DUF6470 family protein [Paenibacillus sp. TRM 82003]|nr:DUF6470 family protein [Paenibacillus sp. TRM 82003]MCI3923389.1 DUF6470 family protein [Paenibacillus sp. TRM 82003]
MRVAPALHIQQQHAKIGIDADLGRYDIRQPRAEMEIQSTRGYYQMETKRGDLVIDQSKAWDALALGGALETLKRIYDKASSVALNGIGRIVERGNRLADLTGGGDPISDIGREEAYRFHEFHFTSPASFDNVDFYYTDRQLDVRWIDSVVDVNMQVRKPEIEYHRGKIDIYVKQYGKVTIIPPSIDLSV